MQELLSLTTPDNAVAFAYDAAGNLTAANDNDSALAFTYDPLNRTGTSVSGGAAQPAQPAVTLTNTYDVFSNRLTLADGLAAATAYAYDGADRLTGLTTPAGAAIALGYDAAGRTSTITRPNAVNTAAAYDTAGRLSQLAHTLGAADLAEKPISTMRSATSPRSLN